MSKINHYEMAIVRDFEDGTTLYVKENEAGGVTYYTDEIGCGVAVWDTAMISEKTLQAALDHYQETKQEVRDAD